MGKEVQEEKNLGADETAANIDVELLIGVATVTTTAAAATPSIPPPADGKPKAVSGSIPPGAYHSAPGQALARSNALRLSLVGRNMAMHGIDGGDDVDVDDQEDSKEEARLPASSNLNSEVFNNNMTEISQEFLVDVVRERLRGGDRFAKEMRKAAAEGVDLTKSESVSKEDALHIGSPSRMEKEQLKGDESSSVNIISEGNASSSSCDPNFLLDVVRERCEESRRDLQRSAGNSDYDDASAHSSQEMTMSLRRGAAMAIKGGDHAVTAAIPGHTVSQMSEVEDDDEEEHAPVPTSLRRQRFTRPSSRPGAVHHPGMSRTSSLNQSEIMDYLSREIGVEDLEELEDEGDAEFALNDVSLTEAVVRQQQIDASLQMMFGSAELLEATLVEEDRSQLDLDLEDDQVETANATRRRSTILAHAVAMPLYSKRFICGDGSRSCHKWLLILLVVVVLGLAVGLGLGFGLSSRENSNENAPNDTSTVASVVSAGPHLERIRERGVLRCGIGAISPVLHFFDENGQRSGFDVALCRAIAAAVLGDPNKVEFSQWLFSVRFDGLATDMADVMAAGTTHTMQRQVYEANTKAGYVFSSPYIYEGLQLAGPPRAVGCIEQFKSKDECVLIKVCAIEGTSHYDVLSRFIPGKQIVVVRGYDEMIEQFIEFHCQVIAHEGHQLREVSVRELGYQGEFVIGDGIFSKEPLALMTRSDDIRWATFVESVLQGLLLAEKQNITQATADLLPQTSAFGKEYQNLFRNAVAAEGNYAELYARYFERIVPRKKINMLNNKNGQLSGLLYTPPLGSPAGLGVVNGYLEEVRNRGKLLCGIIPDRLGFTIFPGGFTYKGVHIDMCRALASSIFEGDDSRVSFFLVESVEEGYAAVRAGLADVFAGATREFQSFTKKPNLSFSPAYFYNDTTTDDLQDNLCLVISADDHQFSSYVGWVVRAVIYAEENGITDDTAYLMPEVNLFGTQYSRMMKDAVLTAGSYGQMYNRSLEALFPTRGRNEVNVVGSLTAQHYAIPGPFF